MNEQLQKTSGTDVLSSKKKNSEKPYGEGGEGFPLKVKPFQNTATYQKLLGGVPFTPPPPSPPPTLYHSGGMNLRVRPRVKYIS